MRRLGIATAFTLAALCLPASPQSPAPATPQAAAPIDITGYWVSLVTEDWRYRMLNAPKGDYYSIPLNAEGKRVADTWDPAKDIAAGKQCMSYGAPNIMRQPARLHITWVPTTTTRAQNGDRRRKTDPVVFVWTGAVVRPSHPCRELPWPCGRRRNRSAPTLRRSRRKIPTRRDSATPAWPRPRRRRTRGSLGGTLKVVTTHIKPGYLRNNGVPFSANAVLTEYYDVHKRGNDEYLVQTQIVEDPKYLNAPWVVSSHYRREPDGSKWDPEPCELVLPSK